MKIAVSILAVILVLTAFLWIAGSILPKGHTATRTVRLRQPPERVWQVITDWPDMPSWRTDLARVERLPDRDGRPVWQEVYNNGWKLPMMIVVSEPVRKLVARIGGPKMSFGGTWTFEIEPVNGGSRLTITENGEVYNPLFRLLSQFRGLRSTITAYETSLAHKFGEAPNFEN